VARGGLIVRDPRARITAAVDRATPTRFEVGRAPDDPRGRGEIATRAHPTSPPSPPRNFPTPRSELQRACPELPVPQIALQPHCATCDERCASRGRSQSISRNATS
jgi:hypothetical protein